ncbi:Radical SAM superfamily protein [Botrimarina colliarenosi]|uniref:Radical SAM superfamily protein n=1 Tax=Botrimarina colliarenosi TaxID=2528001 RepID=A0A5C5ZZ09_9BACT|nr:radical SAM protein [Botrimarina colliarenosi]TWT92325.1 Radical SAM superfamily protein [Botrimarina colliarenosi]
MQTHPLHSQHERRFATNRFVYPVLSRRSGGISVGVNLNPDKVCNFDCVYCQVDRSTRSESRFVETDQLLTELRDVLRTVASGDLYQTPKFADTPAALRRLNDIAFSGDGEPTTYKNFDELMQLAADVKQEVGAEFPAANEAKMVLITNASMFHRPHVERGLAILDANNGEVWAKLDAGTEAYYHTIERTKVPFSQVLNNLANASRVRPLVIQSLFLRLAGEAPSPGEIDAYCDRLNETTAAGGAIKLVQVYTVARKPAESIVGALSDEAVDAIRDRVRRRTGLRAESFYGTSGY